MIILAAVLCIAGVALGGLAFRLDGLWCSGDPVREAGRVKFRVFVWAIVVIAVGLTLFLVAAIAAGGGV